MPPRARPLRRDDQPGYVLHAYPYRESSLIVEGFTADFGRVALVARGAKRPRSELRGLLQGFQSLLFSWSGQHELKTLHKAEWRGGLPRLGGAALLCGFYLNELLIKLLPREDPHPRLFDAYRSALASLARGDAQAPVLRRFEVGLLAELGYALELAVEADSGAAIDPGARYHYAFDKGAQRRSPPPGVRWPLVRGATLVALAAGRFDDAATAVEAKRLMREVIDHHLESRTIMSRRVVRDLQALDEEGPE